MHRTGTSMVTRALHDSGLHLIGSDAEAFIDAAEDNPEGFWENKAIVACNDELLEATGGSWDNPPEVVPLALDDPRVAHIADSSAAAIASLSEHDHWGFKDPRTCLTAAYWLDLVPDLHFVICVRHPLEVALSLKRRNQNSYSLGLRLWERYYATVLDLVPPERRLVTHYDTYFLDPHGEIGRLCTFAGLTPTAPRVRSDLRHHTIGVSLDDAGLSRTLRRLYDALCREAGAPVPAEPPSDEGRVRRLILDGAVAARHAEQRQDAIDRLHEREEAARAARATAETDMRARIRELEQQLARERVAAEQELRDQVRVVEDRSAAARDQAAVLHEATIDAIRALGESVARSDAKLGEIDARTRRTSARVDEVFGFVQPGPLRRATQRSARRVARRSKRIARDTVHQLPPEMQQTLRRGRKLMRRARTDPVPTAKTVSRKLAPKARSAAKRLPPPARQQLRRVDRLYRRARAEPIPTAKRVARRLPEPAQNVLRRAARSVERVERERVTVARRSAPRPSPAPKGPPLRQWKAQYEAMVVGALPAGARWLAVVAGSPKEVRDAHTPRATAFPDARNGTQPNDDLALIAQLEALRFAGHRYLALPEGSRPWFQREAELRDYLIRTYRALVDEPGAGAVFDLGAPAASSVRSLRGEVNRLAAGGASIAVLDWSAFDVAAELPDVAVFRPPPGLELPYLDHSVDIVVLDDDHDLGEARRVAGRAVIVVAARGGAIDVRAVEAEELAPAPAPRTLVWASSTGADDDRWRSEVAARAAAGGADVRFATVDAAGLVTLGDYDVVVVVEEGVVPLPGSIESAARAAVARPDAAIAGKVLRGDGRLEAAGGTVFFDRSVALIAASSNDVRAPWHEYARPVCWAPGIVAASAALWADVPGPDALTGRAYVREWCARVWADGGSVIYQPAVTAVRVSGNGGEASIPLHESSWQRVLDLRPNRPDDLSDGAWRFLLAHDNVDACRGDDSAATVGERSVESTRRDGDDSAATVGERSTR